MPTEVSDDEDEPTPDPKVSVKSGIEACKLLRVLLQQRGVTDFSSFYKLENQVFSIAAEGRQSDITDLLKSLSVLRSCYINY